jgi:hypothetical protein
MNSELLAMLRSALRPIGDEEHAIKTGGTIERIDVSGSTIYFGEATRGSAAGDPAWQITKYDVASSSDITGLIAKGVAWSNRASETYI